MFTYIIYICTVNPQIHTKMETNNYYVVILDDLKLCNFLSET